MQPAPDTLSHHWCASDIHQLETSLRKVQEHYSLLRTKFQQLREDFRFNVDVLAERDQELCRYDLITRGDHSYRGILELKGHPAQHSETAGSDNIQLKIKTQSGIQEYNRLSHGNGQRCLGKSVDLNHEEQIKEIDNTISKLQTEMDSLSAQTMSIKTQQQRQLQDRDDIIDRYKKQLRASLEREKHLEQRLVQMELDWQKNCEDIQSKHYLENERLIQELTEARDKINAELLETKGQLQELTVLLQCIAKERDQALQGCIPGPGSLASDELAALQQQNSKLQAVVTEMRKQMEELSCTTPPPPHRHSGISENKEMYVPKKEHVKQLEMNIIKAKEKVSVSAAVAQLRSRLKQAASCIARLNRDRQQLIELCNRLRAQVCAAQPLSQPDGNAVNHRILQHTDGLKPEVNSQKGLTVSMDQDGPSTLSSPQNSSPLLQAFRPSEESLPSLGELWALLDQEHLQEDLSADLSKDTAEVPPEVFLGLGTGGAEMEVCGVGAPVHLKSTSRPPCKRGHLKNMGKFTRSARIRNYNIKD